MHTCSTIKSYIKGTKHMSDIKYVENLSASTKIYYMHILWATIVSNKIAVVYEFL